MGSFPHRDLVLFLTFSVIVATLVGLGRLLPWTIRRLGLVERLSVVMKPS